MGRRTKIFNKIKIKTIFGRESPRAGHPPEKNALPDVLIAPGPHPGDRIYDSRSDSPGEGSRRGTHVAGDERPVGRDNGSTPAPVCSDRERISSETEHMASNEERNPERQSAHRQDPRDWQDVGDVDTSKTVAENWVTDSSSSDHLNHRAAVSNNQDEEPHVPSAWSPMGHSLSESMRFDNINHSGISIGSGPVNVSNTSFSGGIHQHNPSISYGGGPVNVVNEFHNHNDTSSKRIRSGLKLLEKRVATSAFHSSIHRVDPPRCHPETRVAIQKQIYDWILMDFLVRQMWIMWMHGAAGGGKSAIMQSVAELCEKAQIPLASFFFYRTDPTRNSMAPFIATLVYQLIQKIPEAQVQDEIYAIIENNPLIFEESLESQLQKLIIQPLLRLQAHFKCYFIVMIDGLDECLERAHQVELVELLGTIVRSRATPVIFLVASRREPQIEAAFVRKEVSDLVLTLPLDNSDIEQASDDIRRFLVDKFRDINETHLLKRYLPIDWPPVSSVEEIVSKSSGQFIFASIIIKYLSSPRANPALRLEVIRGIRLRDPSSQNPFAHLDALYEYIFSQVEALDKVLDIIGYVITTKNTSIRDIQRIFLLEDGELDVIFADLTAIILCEPPTLYLAELKFLHASLPDFLVDKSRSDQYHIDLGEHGTNLLCRFLERHPLILDPLWSGNDLKAAVNRELGRLWAIRNLLEKAKASERLHSAFMKFNCTFYSKTFLESSLWYNIGPDILQCLKQLDFSDQGKVYYHVVDIFAAEYMEYWPSFTSVGAKRDSPDLMDRIKQILEQVT